jgi:hypothetical protein
MTGDRLAVIVSESFVRSAVVLTEFGNRLRLEPGGAVVPQGQRMRFRLPDRI